MNRNKLGQFKKKDPKDCPYLGHEVEYKKNWYQKNREKLLKRNQERYQLNKERYSQTTKLWQMANIELVRKYKRKNKDKIRFDGKRNLVLARDEHSCRICGTSKDLAVHHIDGTGQKNDINNSIDNLITLCRSCHLKVHKYKVKI